MNLKTRCRFLIALVLLSPCCSPVFASDEFASWQALNLKYLDTRYVDLVFYGEVRESFEPSRYGGYLLSQQMKFALHPNLGGGINYTFISSPARKTDHLQDTHRAEFELTPQFKLGDGVEVNTRQRLELRWVEGQAGVSERSRSRLQLDFPMHDLGRLSSVYVSGEIFYDYTQHQFTESRIVPVGMTFRLSKKTSLSTFYMLQELRSGQQWYNRHILGTTLSISL
jgi:Protein of unknown function (DUF2490)